MLNKFIPFLIILFSFNLMAQSADDLAAIEQVGMNYIEGFYEGDAEKLKMALSPSLNKFGYWKNPDGEFGEPIPMTYEGAMDFAKDVLENKKFAKEGSPKKVEILDAMEVIAVIKITGWWGYDYMNLSKISGEWKIMQVIWEGPYVKSTE